MAKNRRVPKVFMRKVLETEGLERKLGKMKELKKSVIKQIEGLKRV
jgi:hypothetical protein